VSVADFVRQSRLIGLGVRNLQKYDRLNLGSALLSLAPPLLLLYSILPQFHNTEVVNPISEHSPKHQSLQASLVAATELHPFLSVTSTRRTEALSTRRELLLIEGNAKS
jgi:hypothetical protein